MFVIALNTIKEFIRNKIMYVIVFIAIWLIFFSIILSQLALTESKKIIIDFTLTVIELFWLITTLFLWSYLIYNEITKNTILLILSKKPSRWHFLMWKLLWFLWLLSILYIILTIAFLTVLFVHNIWFENVWSYIFAIFFSYLKISITLGFIILFSSFMSPFVSLLVTLWVYLISHSLWFVKFYLSVSWKVADWTFTSKIVNFLYYFFPNFQDLSMKEYLSSPQLSNYTGWHILLSTWTSIIYIFILMVIAIAIFKKREF